MAECLTTYRHSVGHQDGDHKNYSNDDTSWEVKGSVKIYYIKKIFDHKCFLLKIKIPFNWIINSLVFIRHNTSLPGLCCDLFLDLSPGEQLSSFICFEGKSLIKIVVLFVISRNRRWKHYAKTGV